MLYNRTKRDTLFTQRYCVYSNELTIASQIRFGKSNALRATHQNLELRLKYPSQLMLNAAEDLKIYVKQNEILQNQLPKLPLGIINPMDHSITFPSYENEQAIRAGNEYRFIDLRSTQQKLNFVDHWDVQENITRIFTMIESPLGNYTYVQRNDLNGAYVIENYENPTNTLYADYVQCTFSLKMPKQNDPIYVCGAFNQFKQQADNQLHYNEALGAYQATLQLKQGVYNYIIDGFNGIDKDQLVKNLKKYRTFVDEEDMSDEELIKSYLELNKYHPVSFGNEEGAQNPEEGKVRAMDDFVNYIKAMSAVLNKKAYLKNDISNKFIPAKPTIGFSDDDIRNVEVINKHFKDKPDNIVKTYSTAGGAKKEVK
jgi:hypothetical protein